MNCIDLLSVVVPVAERYDDLEDLHRDYLQQLRGRAERVEFVFVVDGYFPAALKSLHRLAEREANVKFVPLPRRFGESTALTVGFENSSGSVLLILPPYRQVETRDLGRLVDALDGADMVMGRRWPRTDSGLRRAQNSVFNGLVRRLTGMKLRDIGCAARAVRRRVVEEIRLYGDLHLFFPLLVTREGFRVVEVDLAQSNSSGPTFYVPGFYLRRLLDVLTIFFLLKFTKKPLRFFGLVGTGFLGLGGFALLYIIVQRYGFGIPMADRPALLLSTLLLVLGVQIIALGLVGELIIFTHAGSLKEYKIDRIVCAEPDETAQPKGQDRDEQRNPVHSAEPLSVGAARE